MIAIKFFLTSVWLRIWGEKTIIEKEKRYVVHKSQQGARKENILLIRVIIKEKKWGHRVAH